MEIILKENVANVGFKDELVSVKAGYGRNFLIPTGKAVLATESAKKVLAENLKQKAFKEKSIIDAAEKTATKISKLELKISTKVGPDGKLFGSISNADVAKALLDKKIEVEKENISRQSKNVAEAELGVIYTGKVVKTVDFGAFVNFLGSKDGLVHISELQEERTNKTTDVCKEGDEVKVMVIGFDDRGKVKLSMKRVDQETGEDIENVNQDDK